MQTYTYIYWIHTDAMIKTQEDFFNKICTSHFICKGSKRLLKVGVWEGVGDRTETAIFWPLLLWPSALCLSCSPDAQPEAQRPSSLLGDGFLYCILSVSSLDPNSIGVPEGPLGRVWLSLPPSSITPSPTVTATRTLSWLSYIIVQRPLDRPLDLWNRMFNRHQAEITVMQFRCHSLPVRQSRRISWDFLACPILLANFRPRDFLS